MRFSTAILIFACVAISLGFRHSWPGISKHKSGHGRPCTRPQCHVPGTHLTPRLHSRRIPHPKTKVPAPDPTPAPAPPFERCDGVCDAIMATENNETLHCEEDGGCDAGRTCCSVGKNNICLSPCDNGTNGGCQQKCGLSYSGVACSCRTNYEVSPSAPKTCDIKLYKDNSQSQRVCAVLPEDTDPTCGYTICTAAKFPSGQMENDYITFNTAANIEAIRVTMSAGSLVDLIIRKPGGDEVTMGVNGVIGSAFLFDFHKACFSFQPDMNVLLYYADTDNDGNVEVIAVLPYNSLPSLSAGDEICIADASTAGPVAVGFGNMFNEAFNSKDINKLTCDSEGDLISYSDFTVTAMGSMATCPCSDFNTSPSDCHSD